MRKMLLLALALVMALSTCALAETAAPKYVFMFIGDGMGNPQVTATQYYLGAMENPDSDIPVPAQLSFTQFEALGLVTTYDASSFCPDSASTATSMASGEKTLSGVINYNIDKTEPFKLITEYAKEAGKKVGVITSVSLDHATPAAYYAKAPSRKQYYDIAVQGLTGTTLDYLGGGSFLKPDGDGTQENLFELAAENGWTLANTNEVIRALNADSGRVLAIDPNIADSEALNYEIDRVRKEEAGEDILALADYVKAGIDVLDNENGFFMMCEGGKIDWSGHANDAATSIHETIAFSDAVQVAIDFAKEHADETLILVTGDHETGGLTIGFAGTDYDTYLDLLESQKISYAKFDSDYVSRYKEDKTSFEDVLKDVEALFGLKPQGEEGDKLVLTDYELEQLRAAYEKSVNGTAASQYEQEEYVLYGTYEPLSVTLTHIINNKSGISFTSYSHTGLPVAVLAHGVNAGQFNGYYDNTQIYHKLAGMLGIA